MTDSAPQTLAALTQAGEDRAPALAAPGRRGLDYAGLRAQMARTAECLNARGIGRGDRVALVLPNGPEMAAAFLSVGAAASTAPLNPAYTADEFAFYLDDLGARALVLPDGEAGDASPALDVARSRGIAVLRLAVDGDAPAGVFRLEGGEAGRAAAPGPAGPGDEALVLHTSGTTARPKMVPLLQRNLAASARHIADTLRLGPGDRCLNVMPLFHIHGLAAAVLASLAGGASIACTPGFNALKVMAWLAETRPTWITAVPTMHQAILRRAERQPEAARAAGLRFVRSSSASLPPRVMARLEEVFGCPVIESYGMTEAAHQMTSNPLPPGERRPGSVGVPAGPEVAVMDAAGTLLPAGRAGEVAIRGPNVTPGYTGDPEANARAFADGWFRTGDQGVFDADGYLTLTGRLKELINRGGEKISPREVDEALLDHPAVAQAIAFALPHPKLGEEVAAAVVLRDGAEADERTLRAFVGARLAGFKVPRKVVFVPEIPKGATGKPQRIGLAAKLGLAGDDAPAGTGT